jgi:hypothetical protein
VLSLLLQARVGGGKARVPLVLKPFDREPAGELESAPLHDWTATVTHCPASATSDGRSISARCFAGQDVGEKQVSEPIENPLGPKVLPMSPE